MKTIYRNINDKIRWGFTSELYININRKLHNNIANDIRVLFYLSKESQEYSIEPTFFNELK